jgi:hypothetical protein
MIKKWYIPVLIGIISSLVSVIGTLFATQSSNLREQANMVPTLLNEIGVLQREVVTLKSSKNITQDTITAFFEHLPFPAWLKIADVDGNFKMDTINNAYQDEWGVSDLQYKNKMDVEIWGEEVAEAYGEADKYVLDSLSPIIKWQLVPNDPNDPEGEKTLWIVTKFPVEDGYREQVSAIGGIAIPSSIYEIFLDDKNN